MKKILFILLALTIAACGQFQPDTMNISVSLPASIVAADITTLDVYLETVPVGQQLVLYRGIPLSVAQSLGVLNQTYPGLQMNFGLEVEANGEQFAVGVFGLDATRVEVIKTIGTDRYLLRAGVTTGLLPLIQDITDHVIYLNVQVDFQ